MPARIQASVVIDRPVAKVFHFVADEHVRNHPRWDPDIELWLDSPGPIRVGTVIRRRSNRSGTPVEGIMEVVEFERDRSISMLVHDGPAVIQGRTIFEALGDDHTKITTTVELPGMDEAMDTSLLRSRLERSARNMKELIESEH